MHPPTEYYKTKEVLKRQEYPNRKRMREMFEHRVERRLSYDEFRLIVKRSIDLNNARYEAELKMNTQMEKEVDKNATT